MGDINIVVENVLFLCDKNVFCGVKCYCGYIFFSGYMEEFYGYMNGVWKFIVLVCKC